MWQNNLTLSYGKNLTLRRVIGVEAFRNDPDSMISNTPKHLSSLSTNGTKMDCVCDAVKPETEAVNARDNVTDALRVKSDDPLAVVVLTDWENEDERDCDSAVVISNPGMVPT